MLIADQSPNKSEALNIVREQGRRKKWPQAYWRYFEDHFFLLTEHRTCKCRRAHGWAGAAAVDRTTGKAFLH